MVICNRKHTHHDGFSLGYCPSLHVEDSSGFLLGLALLGILVIAPLLVLVLLLWHKSSLKFLIVLPRVRTLPREMPYLSTIIAGIVNDIVVLREWGMNARSIRLTWVR
jgi:hypothetical protein